MSLQDIKRMFEEDSTNSSHMSPAKVLEATRDKLYTMFCSPLKEEYFHEAFNWLSYLCLINGDRFWIEDKTSWTSKDAKIFSFIARVSLAEIQILLPLIQRHLTSGDEPDIQDGKLLARSANSTDYDRFGNHLIILETVIKCLVEGQDLDEADETKNSNNTSKLLTDIIRGEQLINLLDRLKEVMDMICEYLELIHRYWDKLVQNIESEMFSSAEGALRIISIWLSEEPEAYKSQCQRFLIDLICKNLLLIGRPSKDDLHLLAIHSVCAQDDNLMKTLKSIPRHEEALERYLDHTQREQDNVRDDRRNKKIFKLRCGLIKDLLNKSDKSD